MLKTHTLPIFISQTEDFLFIYNIFSFLVSVVDGIVLINYVIYHWLLASIFCYLHNFHLKTKASFINEISYVYANLSYFFYERGLLFFYETTNLNEIHPCIVLTKCWDWTSSFIHSNFKYYAFMIWFFSLDCSIHSLDFFRINHSTTIKKNENFGFLMFHTNTTQ